MSSGPGVSSLDPLLCPPSLFGCWAPLHSQVRSGAALFNNPAAPPLAPAELLRLSHRFPGSHVREREPDRLAVGWRLFVVRERKAEQEEGRGGTWGGASKCVSAWSETVRGAQEPPPRQAALPAGRRARLARPVQGWGRGGGWVGPAASAGYPHTHTHAVTCVHPVLSFHFRGSCIRPC